MAEHPVSLLLDPLDWAETPEEDKRRLEKMGVGVFVLKNGHIRLTVPAWFIPDDFARVVMYLRVRGGR